MEIGTQLVISVHVDLFLQLTSDILVSIISAQVLVQLGVPALVLGCAVHLLFLFTNLLFGLIVVLNLVPLVIEGDDQLVLLGSCERHIILNFNYNF